MYNVVNKSVFGISFQRLDAEYVERAAVEYENALTKGFGGQRLASLVESGKHVQDDARAEEEAAEPQIRYISIDSVDTSDGLSFETAYLSKEDLPSRAKHFVRPGDILVSNVRPNRGAVALIREDQDGAMASSGFTLIRLGAKSKISSEYLFAVLKTPYVRNQLMRRSRGSMYPAVLREDVLELFIPFVSNVAETKAISLVRNAIKYQQDFFSKKRESAALLNAFLAPIGAPPSPTATRKVAVDLTEVSSLAFFGPKGAKRFDAEFFRGEYDDFDAACSKLPNFLLGEKFTLNPGRAFRASSDVSPYAKQAVLTNVGINWSALDEEEGTIPTGAWTIQINDILLACTAHEIPYVGRKCDVVTSLPQGISRIGYVPDLMALRPKGDLGSLSLYYVAAFLRSPSGLHQVQRCIRGLRGGHVYKTDLEQFVRIPMPPSTWMEKFDALEKQAEHFRGKAKAAVQSAIDLLTIAFDDAAREHLAPEAR